MRPPRGALNRPGLLAAALGLLYLLTSATGAFAHPTVGKPTMPKLTEKEEERVRQGKLVLRTQRDENAEGAALITGVIEIDATAEATWKILTNFESIPESSKAVKEVGRYLDRPNSDGSKVVNLRYLVKVAWVSIVYHVHHDLFPAQHYLHWTLDEAKENDLRQTIGSFSLWPGSSAGKIRFLYITTVDTGRNIPEWVEEELTESSLKRYLLYVKKRAEQ
tara:strand:+ start:169 stop:828 length:660 start_codon:yes stop_codon:yes gene_type:complete